MLSITFVAWSSILLLPFIDAREQHVFSLDSPKALTVTPYHHQPWSLVISQNTRTLNCVILSHPQYTQSHKSVQEPGDAVIVNKSPSSIDGWEGVEERTLEIIGFDKRIIWNKAAELCSSLDSSQAISFETDTLAEYEVVY